ncbi:MAG: AraC family transcriptional regulator [Trueperaceae bacterium]
MLTFAPIAQGRDFHAALVELHDRGAHSGPPHNHDYWEAMLVLEGRGEHRIGGHSWQLEPGALLLIRPRDCHSIHCAASERLLFINIAFPVSAWHLFCSLAALGNALDGWSKAASPPTALVAVTDRERCETTFRSALHAFASRPEGLELIRFWSSLVDYFSPNASSGQGGFDGAPAWLEEALGGMHDSENLREGLARLQELSGVSPAHLARTFRRNLGKSPTEFVNSLRLERASLLLNTTTLSIIDIALDCGFENLSYFYRLFRARYGCPPKTFRLRVRKQIAPQSDWPGRVR